MATDKYYAWTEIKNGNDVIKAGDAVKKSDFDEDDWDQLVESRAVRKAPYPDMPSDWTGSPRDWEVKRVREQLEAAEDMLGEDEIALAADREANETVELGDSE